MDRGLCASIIYCCSKSMLPLMSSPQMSLFLYLWGMHTLAKPSCALCVSGQVRGTTQQQAWLTLSPEPWSQPQPAAETPATTSCTTRMRSTRGAFASAKHGNNTKHSWRNTARNLKGKARKLLLFHECNQRWEVVAWSLLFRVTACLLISTRSVYPSFSWSWKRCHVAVVQHGNIH